jgi:hypothetical protein
VQFANFCHFGPHLSHQCSNTSTCTIKKYCLVLNLWTIRNAMDVVLTFQVGYEGQHKHPNPPPASSSGRTASAAAPSGSPACRAPARPPSPSPSRSISSPAESRPTGSMATMCGPDSTRTLASPPRTGRRTYGAWPR